MKSQYCFLMSYAWFAPSYLVEDTVVERSTLSSLVADNQPLFNTGRTNKKNINAGGWLSAFYSAIARIRISMKIDNCHMGIHSCSDD